MDALKKLILTEEKISENILDAICRKFSKRMSQSTNYGGSREIVVSPSHCGKECLLLTGSVVCRECGIVIMTEQLVPPRSLSVSKNNQNFLFTNHRLYESYLEGKVSAGTRFVRRINNLVESRIGCEPHETGRKYMNTQRMSLYSLMDRWGEIFEIPSDIVMFAKMKFHQLRKEYKRIHKVKTALYWCFQEGMSEIRTQSSIIEKEYPIKTLRNGSEKTYIPQRTAKELWIECLERELEQRESTQKTETRDYTFTCT